MANITVTYSFTNGTAADAGQVNTNFNDIISGTSDGTKDFNIAALTCAGTSTFNGNVLLGNASGDDVQFNGSLATSIPIKTQRTYDIGSADLGLRLTYLGMNSTYTIAFGAPSSGASADYTILLPATVPSNGQFLRDTDGAGTLGWKTIFTVNNSAGTSGETLSTSTTDYRNYNPSAAITVKLDNSFKAGRVLTIDNSGTHDITLTANDDTTIRKIYRGTCAIIVCRIDTPTTNTSWRSVAPVTSGWIDRSADFDVVNCGSETSLTVFVKRSGKSARVKGYFICGTLPGATNNPYIDLPADLTIESDHVVSAKIAIGWFRMLRTAAGTILDGGNAGIMTYLSSDTDKAYFTVQSGGSSASYDVITNPSGSLAGTGSGIDFDLEYSVDDWEEFSG